LVFRNPPLKFVDYALDIENQLGRKKSISFKTGENSFYIRSSPVLQQLTSYFDNEN